MRDAVRTSPDSFLRTVEDVDAKPRDYWIHEIQSSKWAVVQCNEKVVGIAASKRPNPEVDSENPRTSRYIESLWVAPQFRRKRLAQHLMTFLITVEYWDNQNIDKFVLWVYQNNASAIALYEKMGFIRTPEKNVGTRTEIKYRLEFNPEAHTTVSLTAGRGPENDQLHRGVTVRLLGQPNLP
jgi:ribosomal protein S18 acetylase RimI-like enzyme